MNDDVFTGSVDDYKKLAKEYGLTLAHVVLVKPGHTVLVVSGQNGLPVSFKYRVDEMRPVNSVVDVAWMIH